MLKQENLVPGLIVAGFIVAATMLFGTRHEYAKHARLDRWTGEVHMCIPVDEHLVCR